MLENITNFANYISDSSIGAYIFGGIFVILLIGRIFVPTNEELDETYGLPPFPFEIEFYILKIKW